MNPAAIVGKTVKVDDGAPNGWGGLEVVIEGYRRVPDGWLFLCRYYTQTGGYVHSRWIEGWEDE